jgi:hypothetical protein
MPKGKSNEKELPPTPEAQKVESNPKSKDAEIKPDNNPSIGEQVIFIQDRDTHLDAEIFDLNPETNQADLKVQGDIKANVRFDPLGREAGTWHRRSS